MKIAVASLAHVHAENYIRILKARSDLDVFVADPPEEVDGDGHATTRVRVAQLGVDVLNSYDEMFSASPDGIVVCTPNAQHRWLTEEAAARGIAVLTEKPIATTVEDAIAMVRSCRRAGVPLMLAHPVRFSRGIRGAWTALAHGTIGTLIAATGSNIAWSPVPERPWFADPVLAGGGALIDHTVHLADVLTNLLPDPVEKVYAQTTHGFDKDALSESGALVTLTFARGVVATIDASWSQPVSSPNWGGASLTLIGDRGELTVDIFADAVQGSSTRRPKPIWKGYGENLDALMLAEFLQAIREQRPARPDGLSGLAGLAIVLAAYDSARTGQPRTVPRIAETL